MRFDKSPHLTSKHSYWYHKSYLTKIKQGTHYDT